MEQLDIRKLNQLGDQLEILLAPLRPSHYTVALNREEEREKLYQAYQTDKVYHPQFIYQDIPPNWGAELRNFFYGLKPSNAWEILLHSDIQHHLDSLDAIVSRDPDKITAITISKHGIPSHDLVEAAKLALKRNEIDVEPEKNISAQDAAEFLRQALQAVELTEWRVNVEDMNAGMSVRGVEQLIRVRQDDMFSEIQLKRLLVHEIGTHVFRYANGIQQKLRLLRFGLSGYMMTEEGMATYHEHKFKLRNRHVEERYALRVIAAQMSLTHGFHDVFAHLVEYTDKDIAFDITVRAKRGFNDTSAYGTHIKDKVYLEGFIKVSAHLETYPDDYPLLMSGKISLDMLPQLCQLQADGLWIKPRYLPEMLL